MKQQFRDTISLMYTDTDSLICYIKIKDFYDDLPHKPRLLECKDTANLPRTHLCYVAGRKKISGLVSDEYDHRVLCVTHKIVRI